MVPYDSMDRSTRHLFAAFVGIGLILLVWFAPDIGQAQTATNGAIEVELAVGSKSIAFPPADPTADAPPVPIAHVRILDGPHADQVLDAFLAGPGSS